MTFRSQLKKLMFEKNINQKKLSELTGISRPSISYYLSGGAAPRDDYACKIAEALGVQVEYFDVSKTGSAEKPHLKNIGISEAAKRLGKSINFVKKALEQGTAPFGFAACFGDKWSYHISPKKFKKYVGERGD